MGEKSVEGSRVPAAAVESETESSEEERSSSGAPAAAAGISWVKVGPTALSGPLILNCVTAHCELEEATASLYFLES